jgi:hypothetical protein
MTSAATDNAWLRHPVLATATAFSNAQVGKTAGVDLMPLALDIRGR